MKGATFMRRGLAPLLGTLAALLLGGATARGVGNGRTEASPAVADNAARPAASARADGGTAASDGGGGDAAVIVPVDPRVPARAAMAALTRTLQLVDRIGAKAPPDAYSRSCVAEKRTEARIGVQLGETEMKRLESSLAQRDDGERAYALRRLQLLVERAQVVLAGARACATDDPGGITATKVEVEISPKVPAGDPTAPPLPTVPDMRPPNDGR